MLARAQNLLPELPTDELDTFVVQEIGKDISGTGLDTNVIGQQWFHGQPELAGAADATCIYAQSLTAPSYGNALGLGLADFVYRSIVLAVDFGDTYINIIMSGEPMRAKIPFVVPADETVFKLRAPATTGVRDPRDLRFAIIRNILEPDDLLISGPPSPPS